MEASIIKVRKLRLSKVKEFLQGQKELSDSGVHSPFIGIISRKLNHLYSLAINVDRFKQLSELKERKIKTMEKFSWIHSSQCFKMITLNPHK